MLLHAPSSCSGLGEALSAAGVCRRRRFRPLAEGGFTELALPFAAISGLVGPSPSHRRRSFGATVACGLCDRARSPALGRGVTSGRTPPWCVHPPVLDLCMQVLPHVVRSPASAPRASEGSRGMQRDLAVAPQLLLDRRRRMYRWCAIFDIWRVGNDSSDPESGAGAARNLARPFLVLAARYLNSVVRVGSRPLGHAVHGARIPPELGHTHTHILASSVAVCRPR